MRILDNYILKSLIRIFFLTILVFCFLYVLVDTASNLDEIIRRKTPVPVLFLYYASFLPIILTQTSPVACLIASIFTFSRLNSQNEIIALRSSGLNFWQIIKPALYFSILIAAFIFWINERFVPQATANSENIRNENIILQADSDQRKEADIKNLTFYGLKNRLYFIDSFDPVTYELDGITITEQDNNQNLQKKVVALKGRWTGAAWKFYQCHITTFKPPDIMNPPEIVLYNEKIMDDIKETPLDFIKQRLNVATMNIRQLYDYIQRFSNSGATKALNNLRVDLQQKISYPLGNVVITLVGMPLAMMTGRRKAMTFTSLGLAIGIGFLFYVVNAVGLALGKGGILPPILAAWLAPAAFLGLAWYLIRRL